MKKCWVITVMLGIYFNCYGWGFYAHKLINRSAVFLLPPEMMVLYKPSIDFLSDHAVDPDKRRYAVKDEAPRHYIDMDKYDVYPYSQLPADWKSACLKYSEDTLIAHGIVPWWIQTMLRRLTAAFTEKDQVKILNLSAEIGHYIGDAHVPLHASSNHNGQLTDQHGIHGFWESRIPELLAETEWDLFIGRAEYIRDPLTFTWKRVFESAQYADTVLKKEKRLSASFPGDSKYGYSDRNGQMVKQYSPAYSVAYDRMLEGMIERRLRESVYAVASFWYTAWVNAGQPDLNKLMNKHITEDDVKEYEELNIMWRKKEVKGKICD
jgi:hypothetical protein